MISNTAFFPSGANTLQRVGAIPNRPIVVLAYAHAGDELLADALSAGGEVACTRATGLLPLCHAALGAWRRIENRKHAPSALALKSTRSMVNTMMVVHQSNAGATRWCETTYADPVVAETFLELFPESVFVCLHRSLQAVFSDGIRSYPWGLGDSPFWTHAFGHPGNNVATIAEYWAAHTERLLEFEDRHPQCTLRIRHEDLIDHPDRIIGRLLEFLALDIRTLPEASARRGSDKEAGNALPITQLSELPAQLCTKIVDFHARLDYPALLLPVTEV
jgi:hypothetical protein